MTIKVTNEGPLEFDAIWSSSLIDPTLNDPREFCALAADKINIEESKNIDNENIIDLRNNIQILIDTKYNKKEKNLNEDITKKNSKNNRANE